MPYLLIMIICRFNKSANHHRITRKLEGKSLYSRKSIHSHNMTDISKPRCGMASSKLLNSGEASKNKENYKRKW